MKCPSCNAKFVDAAGAAKILGVSKGRFHNLLADGLTMPPPFGHVGRSPIWLESSVRSLARVRRKAVHGVRSAAAVERWIENPLPAPPRKRVPERPVLPPPLVAEPASSILSGGDSEIVEPVVEPVVEVPVEDLPDHVGKVSQWGRRWVAACSCGWASPAMAALAAAEDRLNLHLPPPDAV